ncbi:hypothetical protein [Streptomyces sp. NPDC057280]|uniref:hypothetical protein n=1 Tax=Streptomyces sp. NPDC057280 TaxID=3346081 RepID=UPI00363C68D9
MSVSYAVPASLDPVPRGRAAFHLARAAGCAPSVHNTQPWFFVDEGRDHGFEVHADGGRRLPLTDPAGREMVISCGAALFNVRVAVRNLGFRPVVTLLPVPADPAFLARVGWGAHAKVTDRVRETERALTRRHTQRGLFGPAPLPWSLIEELRDRPARRAPCSIPSTTRRSCGCWRSGCGPRSPSTVPIPDTPPRSAAGRVTPGGPGGSG